MAITSPAPETARVVGGTRAPVRAEGIELLGEMQGSGYRRPPALVRRTDGQTITLTPLLYLTLRAVDGQRSTDEVARILSAAVDREFIGEDVEYLIETKLRPLGLVVGPDGDQPVAQKSNPLLALRLKFVITNERLTRRITAPFAWLFSPVIAIPLVLGFLAVSWWLLIDKGLASAAHQAFYEPGLILAVWAVIVVSAGFHEFGHAAACRYGGATPGAMGAGLYLVWPAFYTDVTDSYRLGRPGRLRVDLGGLYFNAIFALATWAAWWFLRVDALLLVVVAQHLQMVRQLAPFIRADGYHIIADLIGVPDLFAHIKPTLMSVLPRRWRPTRPSALKPWARAVVIGWVALVVPLLVGVIAFGVLLLPRLVATAWDSMGVQWEAATAYWAEGDLAAFTVRAMYSLLAVLPVAALIYLLVRIARRAAVSAWRSSEHAPKKRAAVLGFAAASLAGVAWAWWPADQYRPIERDSEGTLPDIVRVEDRKIFIPLLERTIVLRSTPTVPVAGQTTTTTTTLIVQPAVGTSTMGSTSTSSAAVAESSGVTTDPATGQVIGSRAAQPSDNPTSRSAWPFPWPMPDGTEEGDNRAWAINTTDDSVVMDLAVAWAIATAEQIDERNEAWALASCEDCVTRAVAFQVLLVTSDVEELAPLNAAVAANYECTRCTTEAIALQLIMSITGVPSAEAQTLIDSAMNRVQMLETDLAALSLEQIYFVLQATEAEIVQILRNDGVIPAGDVEGAVAVAAEEIGTTEPATGEASSSASATSSSDPVAESTTQDQTGTAEPSTAPATEPTAEPSTEPSAEPVVEPTTESSAEPATEPTAEPTPSSEPRTEPSAPAPSEPSP